jgi:hypothetical protein
VVRRPCLHFISYTKGAGRGAESSLFFFMRFEFQKFTVPPHFLRRLSHSPFIRRAEGAGMARTDENAREHDADPRAPVGNDGANDTVLRHQSTGKFALTPADPSVSSLGCVRFFAKPITFSEDRDSSSFGLLHHAHAPCKTLPLPPPSSLPASFSHPRGGGRPSIRPCIRAICVFALTKKPGSRVDGSFAPVSQRVSGAYPPPTCSTIPAPIPVPLGSALARRRRSRTSEGAVSRSATTRQPRQTKSKTFPTE